MDNLDPTYLDRYLAGEATPEDQARLKAWLQENPARGKALRALEELQGNSLQPEAGFDAERIVGKVEEYSARGVGGQRVVIQGDQSKRGYSKSIWPRWTASVGALTSLCIIAVFTLHVLNTNIQRGTGTSQEYRTVNAQRASFRLPDGTHVILAPQSKLRYVASKGNSARNVYLTGEGYFEVSHDPNAPFTVHVDKSVIRVLGTAFGVRGYGDDAKYTVIVASGKIAFNETQLIGGDLGTSDSKGYIQVSHGMNIGDRLAWTTGRLTFDTDLSSILTDLSRWYNVEIRLQNPRMGELQITGSFQQGSVDDLARTLSVLLQAKAIRNGRVITISEGTP